jgi:nucleotide-binding universal stress UspA family protein
MGYSTIMVYYDLYGTNDDCLRIAVDLAKNFNSRLVGITAVNPDLDWSAYEQQALARELEPGLRSNSTERLAHAEEHFQSAVQQYEGEIEWRSAIEQPLRYVADEARSADLVVVGASRNGSSGELPGSMDPGELAMHAGRPVLMVPSEAHRLVLKSAMVTWRDAREARRAVSDALPLLRKVREVAVVELIQDEAARTAAHRRLDDVVAWLDRHGIAAFSRVFHFPEQKDPFEKLWQYGVNFIVAGAFGHSRLRERVFGGFTDDLLRRSPLCTLFSH